MCGRYVTVTKIKEIEKRFNVTAPDPSLYLPNTNISHGQIAPVITDDKSIRPLKIHGSTAFTCCNPSAKEFLKNTIMKFITKYKCSAWANHRHETGKRRRTIGSECADNTFYALKSFATLGGFASNQNNFTSTCLRST